MITEAQGQVLHCKRRNLGCSLPKAGLPLQTQELILLIYQGLIRCSSFPLLSALHSLSLASEQTLKDLKRSQGHQRRGEESGFG